MKKKRKLTPKGFFQKYIAFLFLEKYLFRSWSCLAAVSFVSAILHKAKKIIHAKDGSSYPFIAVFVHVWPQLVHVRKTALNTHIFSSGHLEGSFVNINGSVAATAPKTFRQKSKLLLENLEKFKGKMFSSKLGFFKLFLWSRIMLFWKNLSKTSPKILKKSKSIFCRKMLHFSSRSFLRQNKNFF